MMRREFFATSIAFGLIPPGDPSPMSRDDILIKIYQQTGDTEAASRFVGLLTDDQIAKLTDVRIDGGHWIFQVRQAGPPEVVLEFRTKGTQSPLFLKAWLGFDGERRTSVMIYLDDDDANNRLTIGYFFDGYQARAKP